MPSCPSILARRGGPVRPDSGVFRAKDGRQGNVQISQMSPPGTADQARTSRRTRSGGRRGPARSIPVNPKCRYFTTVSPATQNHGRRWSGASLLPDPPRTQQEHAFLRAGTRLRFVAGLSQGGPGTDHERPGHRFRTGSSDDFQGILRCHRIPAAALQSRCGTGVGGLAAQVSEQHRATQQGQPSLIHATPFHAVPFRIHALPPSFPDGMRFPELISSPIARNLLGTSTRRASR